MGLFCRIKSNQIKTKALNREVTQRVIVLVPLRCHWIVQCQGYLDPVRLSLVWSLHNVLQGEREWQ